MFQSKRVAGDSPLNTAARFLHLEASDTTAHAILERSVALGDKEKDITLSMDLVHKSGRW